MATSPSVSKQCLNPATPVVSSLTARGGTRTHTHTHTHGGAHSRTHTNEHTVRVPTRTPSAHSQQDVNTMASTARYIQIILLHRRRHIQLPARCGVWCLHIIDLSYVD
ncbi:unnamed protein product [Arctogadus glacialis]